jgi:hypothetical protein
MADLDQARAAKARLRSQLAGRDGIRGVGISRGLDGYEVQVNLLKESDGEHVPPQVDGVPVHTHVSGHIQAGG